MIDRIGKNSSDGLGEITKQESVNLKWLFPKYSYQKTADSKDDILERIQQLEPYDIYTPENLAHLRILANLFDNFEENEATITSFFDKTYVLSSKNEVSNGNTQAHYSSKAGKIMDNFNGNAFNPSD